MQRYFDHLRERAATGDLPVYQAEPVRYNLLGRLLVRLGFRKQEFRSVRLGPLEAAESLAPYGGDGSDAA